jgi:hypothetical protein
MAKPDDREKAGGQPKSEHAHEARLAAALRANLIRRKAAVRAAAEGTQHPTGPDGEVSK